MPGDSARPIGRWRVLHCSGHDRAKRIQLQVLTLRLHLSVPSAVSRQPVGNLVTISWHLIGRYNMTIDRVERFKVGCVLNVEARAKTGWMW